MAERYANFWLFTLKMGGLVGLYTSVGLTLGIVFEHGLHAIAPDIILAVFLIASGYGFVAACLGYLAVLLGRRLGRRALKTPVPDWVLSLGVAVILAISVIFYFSIEMSRTRSTWIFFFPVAPLLACVYSFVRLSRKHIGR